jgi:hypothetical protein
MILLKDLANWDCSFVQSFGKAGGKPKGDLGEKENKEPRWEGKRL